MPDKKSGRGNVGGFCAMTGFLFMPAHMAGISFGSIARALGRTCMNL